MEVDGAAVGRRAATPRARRSRSTASISDWLTLQPRFVIAARRTGAGSPCADAAVVRSGHPIAAHQISGFVDMRKAMSPTAVVIP